MSEKILVVDDDTETLRLVGLMLQRQGFDVSTVNNGPQAIKLAQEKLPDVIVLDVMMPEMDGYEVARQIRGNSNTNGIPILMFTARSQVEDKVAGYEAGVDDYLTKPIHPAELVARIRALLSRGRGRSAAAPVSTKRGYLVGILAPRGGMGASSLTLNLSMTIYRRNKIDAIAAELVPGHGTWTLELGLPNADSLNNLLSKKPEEITLDLVEEELVKTAFGVRLLFSSHSLKDIRLNSKTAQFQSLLQKLSYLSSLTLVDLGSGQINEIDDLLTSFQELIVLTEPFPGSVKRTRLLLDQLQEKGFGKSRFIQVVLYNRIRSDMQLSVSQVQEMLERPVSVVIPPFPELAYQATLKSLPMVHVQPEGLLAQQMNQLADNLADRVTHF